MRRELDAEAVRRSDVIVADDVEGAKTECGDLIYAIEQSATTWGQVSNLSEVIVGRAKGRESDRDTTLFESQGVALEDIAVGLKVYEMALERGVGQTVPF